MIAVYVRTKGIPISAMIAIISSVFLDDAALKMVRLHSGLRLETIRFGYSATINRKTNAAIEQQEVMKA
jgi:hypothetical protein